MRRYEGPGPSERSAGVLLPGMLRRTVCVGVC